MAFTYNPTNWKSNDLITAEKLNNLEKAASQVAINSARIDNLVISDPITDEALKNEVIDARVTADGVQKANLKEAIDTQVTQLSESIVNLNQLETSRKGLDYIDFNGLDIFQIKNANIQYGKYLAGYNTSTFEPIIMPTTDYPDALVLDCPVSSIIDLGIDTIVIPQQFGNVVNRCVQYTSGAKATNNLPQNRVYKVNNSYERVALVFENKFEIFKCTRNFEDFTSNLFGYVGYDAMKKHVREKVKNSISVFNYERTKELFAKTFDGQFLSIEVFNGNSELYEYRVENTYKAHTTNKNRRVDVRVYRKTDGNFYRRLTYQANNGDENIPPSIELINMTDAVSGTSLIILMDWTKDNNDYLRGAVIDDAIVHSYPIPSEKVSDTHIMDVVVDNAGDLSFIYNKYSENKFSGGYSIDSRLPIWKTDTDYITYSIPLPNHGYIHSPLSTSPTVLQSYLLKEDGTVLINFLNKGDAIDETISGYSRTETECIVNCEKAYNRGARYLTISFATSQDYYIKAIGSYIPEWLNVEKIADLANVDANIESVLPKTLVVCGGREMNIYYQNIMRYINIEKCHLVNVRGNNNFTSYGTDFARWNAPENVDTNFALYFGIYTKNTAKADIITSSIDVIGIPQNSGNGLTKKVMFIGDSLTDAGVYPKEIKNLFNDDSMNVELIGTLDTSTGANEGRNGWRAYTYCRCKSNVEDWATWGETPPAVITNPFYNQDTGKFDFSLYMSNNGFSGIDYVFICLGTNDIGRGNHQTENELKEYWDEMITSIKEYNPNVRIGLWLPPTRSLYKNHSRTSIDNSLKMNKWIIQTYDGKQNENLFLVPVYMNIDPYHDYKYEERPVSARNNKYTMQICIDQIHPAEEGYHKIADVIYSYIKYFGKLDTN